MTALISPLWTETSSEARLTGTWRSEQPVYETRPSPCHGACPLDGHIADWIGQVRAGAIHEAWLTLVANNPFPAIIGRICHHPCENVCNRAELDETVGICNLERHVGDAALALAWAFPAPPASVHKSVAIIGGGPAGLGAAYHLRRAGVAVHIYEGRDKLGGLMRYGIPAYRLSRDVLDGEIDRLLAMGVEVSTACMMSGSDALEKLRSEHDAVFIATGAQKPKKLPGLDYTRPDVIDSADYLAAANGNVPLETGERVVVIGGGSAAMDVARTARRLGKSVTVLALEPRDALPAQCVEIDEAHEENVRFLTSSMLKTLDENDEGLCLLCCRVKFEPGAARGEFSANPIKGSDFILSTDAVVVAIGQDTDLSAFGENPGSDGRVFVIDEAFQTNQSGIYAGGDAASVERFVSQALGMGKNAAEEILRGFGITDGDRRTVGEVPFEIINAAYQSTEPRQHPPSSEPARRLEGFDEVQGALSQIDAQAEATRCFSCGTCIYCDNCYFYCPDMAITRLEHGYEVKSDYCKGCGLCVAECPTGSIHMELEGLS